MQTPEKLANQLLTVEKLQTVVRTMKTLSAVSIQQYEAAAQAITSYRATTELGLRALLMQNDLVPELQEDSVEPRAAKVIVFGSDHGLCGRFNENVVDHALTQLARADCRLEMANWYAVGSRAAMVLEMRGLEVSSVFQTPSVASGLSRLSQVIIRALDHHVPGEVSDSVYLAHNSQAGDKVRQPLLFRLLPIDKAYLRSLPAVGWQARGLPIIRMDPAQLFSSLVRQYLFAAIFEAGAQSLAAEHAQRLSAMQNAERNISDRGYELRGEYQQARQNEITSEIFDVVTGYEVLTGERRD